MNKMLARIRRHWVVILIPIMIPSVTWINLHKHPGYWHHFWPAWVVTVLGYIWLFRRLWKELQ